MKTNKNYIILLLFSTIILNCNNNSRNNKQQSESNIIEDFGETICVYRKTEKKISNTFPFNSSNKIEIVFYYDRKDKIRNAELIKENKFIVDNIKERVILNENQKIELFHILYDYKIKRIGNITATADYNPNHSIVFYSDNKAIAFLEIGLECGAVRHSKNADFGEFCDDKYCMLQTFFKKCGLKLGFWDIVCK